MAKSNFSTKALDDLLADAIEDTNIIQNELAQYANVTPVPATAPGITNMIEQKSGDSVDFNRVYSELEKLIENGNVALQVLSAIDPDVSGSEVASATAALMNAIKGCMAEFTKIHMQHIKFQQQMQLEELKHKHKLEQIKAKGIVNKDSNQTEQFTEAAGQVSLVEWETESVTKYINFLKNNKK